MKHGKRGRPSFLDDNQRAFIFQELTKWKTSWEIAKRWDGVEEQNISYYKRKYNPTVIMADWLFNIN